MEALAVNKKNGNLFKALEQSLKRKLPKDVKVKEVGIATADGISYTQARIMFPPNYPHASVKKVSTIIGEEATAVGLEGVVMTSSLLE